jgi:hypothetical protein
MQADIILSLFDTLFYFILINVYLVLDIFIFVLVYLFSPPFKCLPLLNTHDFLDNCLLFITCIDFDEFESVVTAEYHQMLESGTVSHLQHTAATLLPNG